ncbi:Major tail sheath protein FI [Escherichia coli]|nr:Major tail sheath protein FI [Escherichia coli]
MSETRFHGARVTENTDLVTAINDVDSSVIGIVATADDADAKLFPLNKPTLLTRVNDVLGKCGTTGTLYRALKAIADQVSTKVIVVRVAEHKEEDGKTQDQLVIGGSEDDGSYTGMYALLVAEQDESIGYRPRILAAPELDTEAVTKSLCVIAGKLRAFVYASCHGCNTMAEAITYRQKFNEREVMLLWPDFIAYNPKSGKNETFPAPAYACGLRAYIDHEQGWHKSLSNVPVKNVLGIAPTFADGERLTARRLYVADGHILCGFDYPHSPVLWCVLCCHDHECRDQIIPEEWEPDGCPVCAPIL